MSEKSEVERAINSLGELRLIGFQVKDNDIFAEVETYKKPVYCPSCTTAAEPKDRRTSTIRDLPLGDKSLILLWKKRVWTCPNPECSEITWTESADFVTSRHSLTNRAKINLMKDADQKGVSISKLAQKWKVSWSTAMTAIREAREMTRSSQEKVKEMR